MTSLTKRATPETDAAALGFARILIDHDKATTTELVEANFARSLEQRLGAAVEALEKAATAVGYDSHEDSVGYKICCGNRSYEPHAKSCDLMKTLAAIKEAT